ncbi:protein tyrosine phosphatase receptor type C-associated protein [Lacerta agilis]|uniref:protein tyrosine phosphatase receptor type C-associated protein n=1 Tax=Lacerta agilis TaxID=80427 RepID=UPI00141A5F12|nr:protein tyrosine phosphatase receptor type C-associated protein [Lacerta agilis]
MQCSRAKSTPLLTMRPQFVCTLSALLLLFPGKAMGAAPERGGGRGKSSDDIVVSFLVCLLLLLLLLLFLAWRRLSRNSGGRYHPQRLLRGLMLRWQGLWGGELPEEPLQGHRDEKPGDEESGEEQPIDVGDEREQQQLLQGEDEEEEEEEEEEVEEKQEASKEKADPEPAEDKAVQEVSEEEGAPKATESSAGALLSDLHSFSGTAAWEDPGKQLHVTAL